MRSSHNRTDARRVFAVATLLALTFAAPAAQAARDTDRHKESSPPAPVSAADSFVGVWKAILPNGLLAGAVTLVPAAGGVAGVFVGYDYDRPMDPEQPISGAPPKIAIRSGGVLLNPSFRAGTLAFEMQIRMTSPPPGAPEYFAVRGEMSIGADGRGELKLFSVKKAEPLTLKLTRE